MLFFYSEFAIEWSHSYLEIMEFLDSLISVNFLKDQCEIWKNNLHKNYGKISAFPR